MKKHKKVKRKLDPPCIEKEVSYPVKNLEGNVLAGVLHEPQHKSKALAIVVHGLFSHKNQTLIKQICIDFARSGISAYRFDFSGSGDSEGRFEDATPKKLLHDLLAVIEHFRKSYTKVFLVGHSLGGTLAIITASRAKIDALVTISSPMHPEHFEERLSAQQREELKSVGFTTWTVKRPIADIPYTITERFVEEMKFIDPLDAAKDVHCPALIVHGTGDRVVLPTESEELFDVLFAKEILLIGGADHNFTHPNNLDALIEGVITWSLKHIKHK